MTVLEFACEMGVTVSVIEKMLNGEAVEIKTAQLFINCLGAKKASQLIDWDALGKKNPLAD